MATALLAAIAARAASRGIDLVVPFSPGWLDPASPEGVATRALGASDDLGVFFANSRALWEPFSSWLDASPSNRQLSDPLDHYIEDAVRFALGPDEARARIAYAHAVPPEGAFPIQRLAQAIGFAALAPSYLSVHPTHGPWVALRAAVVIEGEPFVASPAAGVDPCHGCPAPCVAALERARADSAADRGVEVVTRHADAWIAVRDACPIGRDARYGEAQLDLHYRRRLPSRG